MGHDDHRVRRIKEYVLARLRDELGHAPRGAQARLARRLGVSGAHLSNMLSPTPSRQPGEDFRRKVAAHWGVTYAELEALALGEEAPPNHAVTDGGADAMPPNLAIAVRDYSWMRELPAAMRSLVREQARQHFAHSHHDLPPEEWRRVLTGLEREALAHRARVAGELSPAAVARKGARARKRRPEPSRRTHDP